MWNRTFADLLDEALTPAPVEAAAGFPPAQACATPPHPLLFFTLPAFAGRRVTYRPATPKTGMMPDGWWTPPAAAAAPEPTDAGRPVRTLTAAQRQALDGLTHFGANLTSDFTAADLRREYRLLARRVHPDRHHHASDAERDHLSRQFAAITDHYRRLLATLEPRH